MVEVHVGRQPIYRPDRSVHGYELLFRAAADVDVATSREDDATSSVIVAAVLEFGLEQLTAPHLAFINITRAFAVGTLPLPMPPEGVVLELLEDVVVDAEVRDGVRALMGQGFTLALDDFEWQVDQVPLLHDAAYVKIDITGKSPSGLRSTVDRLRDHDVLTVAERIESAQDLDICLGAGFDLLQGYHLLRPATISARCLSPNTAARLQLVERLCDRDVSLREVEPLVAADAALTLRILRAVQSASAGLHHPVDTLPAALMMLGLDQVRAWATVMALAQDGQQSPSTSFALTRGRFCQLLANDEPEVAAGAAFLAGMLSALPHVLDVSAADLCEQLPLSPALREAVTSRAGRLGQLLDVVEAYDLVQRGSRNRRGTSAALAGPYLAALAWSQHLTRSA